MKPAFSIVSESVLRSFMRGQPTQAPLIDRRRTVTFPGPDLQRHDQLPTWLKVVLCQSGLL